MRSSTRPTGPSWVADELMLRGLQVSSGGVWGVWIWDGTIEEMEKDPDVCFGTYTRRRPHQGRGMKGCTPYEAFKAGMPRRRTRKHSARSWRPCF